MVQNYCGLLQLAEIIIDIKINVPFMDLDPYHTLKLTLFYFYYLQSQIRLSLCEFI